MRLGLALLAAAALLLAACGGDRAGGKRLTKAELIKRGDAICTKYRARNQALNKEAPAKNPTDPSATDAQILKSGPVLRKLADNVRGARAEFAQLRPPSGVESDWGNTLDDLDLIAARLDAAANAAERVDRQRIVNEYGEILRLNRRVSAFESDYGFHVCGRTS